MKGNRSQAHLSSQKVLGEGGLGRKGVGECFSHQNEWENCETVLRVFFRLVVRDEDESDTSESPEEAIINEIFPSKAKRYSDLLF